MLNVLLIQIYSISCFFYSIACRFRGERGDEKFVRLKEDAIKGSEAFRISAFPRSGFKIQSLDGVSIKIKISLFEIIFIII
jgi:hypothetical protein